MSEQTERERLTDEERAEEAIGALEALDEDALGRDPREGYPYRDELLHNVRAALDHTEQGGDDG